MLSCLIALTSTQEAAQKKKWRGEKKEKKKKITSKRPKGAQEIGWRNACGETRAVYLSLHSCDCCVRTVVAVSSVRARHKRAHRLGELSVCCNTLGNLDDGCRAIHDQVCDPKFVACEIRALSCGK
jgi:hypothetical protein